MTGLPHRSSVGVRLLHWVVAGLVLWQIGIVAGYRLTGGGTVMDRIASLGPSHGTVGLIVLPLAVVRLVIHPAAANPVARVVHAAMRLLLVAIPALGLLRAWGSGKGWMHWGIQIIPETGVEVTWMVTLGNMAHGELAWLMTALIALHICGAVWHGIGQGVGTRARSVSRETTVERPATAGR